MKFLTAKETALWEEAYNFLSQCYKELKLENELPQRLEQVRAEIQSSRTYHHTFKELEFGARVAWRNNVRCIGRIYWKTLKIFDARQLSTTEEIYQALSNHLKFATNKGNIRSAITIFRQKMPDEPNGIQIENSQLIRYAGYPQPNGTIIGDPAQLKLTQQCLQLGWKPPQQSNFDILPWLITLPEQPTAIKEAPLNLIKEVPLEHPTFEWWKTLQLKWHAVPVISDMILEIGGIQYTAAPFNGWYMGTEIGSRNLGDQHRYNLLPQIAQKMGLDTSQSFLLWKDRALVELNTSVLYSFQKYQVKINDHHEASDYFIHFEDTEKKQGRTIAADWSWIVPPMSASATAVFHKEYENKTVNPNFYYRTPDNPQQCPFKSSK